LAKLKCGDYGFECDFVVQGEMEIVLQKFTQHTDEEHGIDYSKEVLMQVILRKST
jgi:predicted small metal-binding protein